MGNRRREAIIQIEPELIFEGKTERLTFYSLGNAHIKSSRWGYYKNKPVHEFNDWTMIRLWLVNEK